MRAGDALGDALDQSSEALLQDLPQALQHPVLSLTDAGERRASQHLCTRIRTSCRHIARVQAHEREHCSTCRDELDSGNGRLLAVAQVH